MKSADYEHLVGQEVAVQLMAPAVLFERGEDGSIQPARIPDPDWVRAQLDAMDAPTSAGQEQERINQLVGRAPARTAPPSPVVIGVLRRVKGELLELEYENVGRKLRMTLRPDDVKHVVSLHEPLIT